MKIYERIPTRPRRSPVDLLKEKDVCQEEPHCNVTFHSLILKQGSGRETLLRLIHVDDF